MQHGIKQESLGYACSDSDRLPFNYPPLLNCAMYESSSRHGLKRRMTHIAHRCLCCVIAQRGCSHETSCAYHLFREPVRKWSMGRPNMFVLWGTFCRIFKKITWRQARLSSGTAVRCSAALPTMGRRISAFGATQKP